ncbi:Zinc finger-domain containing protein [Parasponia andersonii]|uniref:Zinc finger-domain containing protein n=1 Tax=Parasponia andersonii TaxID=3476 RepID=A0A2P5DZ84_PARAD|nr:Zinc finger-domain containing protein [Parasponia andersonii]
MNTSMNYNNKKASNDVVGGKTARACDNCVKKRARWYCASDDAFLCQACDHSVHSANSLARRHERVRLKTASSSRSPPPLRLKPTSHESPSPTWHQGFTRKARTPRHGRSRLGFTKPRGRSSTSSSTSSGTAPNPFSLVPEFGGDETSQSHDENEEQLLYRVPIYDPFVAQLCSSVPEMSKTTSFGANDNNHNGTSPDEENNSSNDNENLHGFLLPAHEMDDLAEFAADVESLLGRGLENDECFGMEVLGFVDCKDGREKTTGSESRLGEGRVVKVEEDEEGEGEGEDMGSGGLADMMRETFELNFDDYDESPPSCGEEEVEEEKVGLKEMKNDKGNDLNDVVKNSKAMMMTTMKKKKKKKKKILLRLDYEAVSTAWASQGGSPWTTGDRPDFDPDACLPDCLSTCNAAQLRQHHHHHHYVDMGVGVGGLMNAAILGDGGREARVSRYREKRRTRLFSKKIRYEVRKLNAEKRPRMKGRFVKRASFMAAALPTTFPKLK